MQYQVFIFSLMGLAFVGCGSQIEGGGSGGSGGSMASSSTGMAGNGGSMGTGGNGGSAGSGGIAGQGGSMGTGGMATASSSSSSSGSGGGGCGICDFNCCDATCVNLNNDLNNCGVCGNKCPTDKPYCDNGVCATPPCNGPLCSPAATCCGSNCCKIGEICCAVPGPIGVSIGCQMPTATGTCPTGCATCQCSSPDTLIATPTGEKPIASLVAGDLVYSVHQGAVVAVPIRQTQRNPVANHFVLHVEFTDGRAIEISSGHPTADGHSFADLRPGSLLGTMTVVDVQRIAYAHPFTYDILPDSETGTYFASGALIGSTMSKPAMQP